MNILKATILLIAGTFGGLNSAARADVFEGDDNRAYMGVRASFDIAALTQADAARKSFENYESGTGGALGAICNVPLWKNLYFEPGASLYYNTVGYKLATTDEFKGTNHMDCSAKRFGLRLPFMFGYRFDFAPCSVSVFTGPMFDFCLSGRYDLSIYVNDDIAGPMQDGSFKHCEFCWRFGAGVAVKRFVFEVSGALGLRQTYKDTNLHYRNNLVQFTVGYNFGKFGR